MHELMGMKATLDKGSLIKTLRKNREKHVQIVKEAREGYLKQAEEQLEARLARIRQGEVCRLGFSLAIPEDRTAVYDTALCTLELHTKDDIQLAAEQVRNLVMDEWEWKDRFLTVNSRYSNTAKEQSFGQGQE